LLSDGVARFHSRTLDREIVCRPAKMRQLTLIIEVFETVVNRIDAESLGAIVELVADAQRAQLGQGQDPNDLPYAGMTATEIVNRAKERVNVVALLTTSLLGEMPKIAQAFSDVSSEEYDQLDLDEGMSLLLAIFTVNYSFFIQSLPPMFSAYMQTWASKNPEKSAAVRAIVKRTTHRR
jgi:hypothetical protein